MKSAYINIVCILSLIVFLVSGCQESYERDFLISDKQGSVPIYLDENADSLILWAVNDLADDIEKITGFRPLILHFNLPQTTRGIYIGEFKDTLINSLNLNEIELLRGEWEKYHINIYDGNLVIAGSDIRGAVFGVFDVAERLGISPWKWWGDVTLTPQNSLSLRIETVGITEKPSVQYRGIFLNDEDWGLQPWAAKTFEPETGDIGPATYERIFQLLLRLKANTIWPAMHPCTEAFFCIPGNMEMAEKYHISIGTSHAEPMLRNNVDEWEKDIYGDFNYFKNDKKVREYWKERITETKRGNNIVTLGMRGIHDSGMEGNASKEEKVSLLEKIILDQREMLAKTINKSIEEIPQVFTLYKEVLNLYNNGLSIPEDVTLMWTDDNYGYIRRLSSEQEQKRKGGSGIYYHLSYWGRPHDYLWLSTTQPGLIWYEMTRAYQNGAHKIWIANVGDIKPCEYGMEFFLDLAWDINSISETTIRDHLLEWSAREFGEERNEEISDLMQEYYRLAFLRKPEYMGWSQTEPTRSTKISGFSNSRNNNEVQRRIDAYSELVEGAEEIKVTVPKERMDAYFQLVEYPVKGAALMNHKFLYAQQSYLSTDTLEKEKLAEQSEMAFEQIKTLTSKYNNDIDGKWQKMMSMNPRSLPVFDMPEYHLFDSPAIPDRQGENQEDVLISIQAKDYATAKNSENYKWKAIEGLGYSNSSVSIFPLNNHSFQKEEPYLEYSFDIEKADNYMVEIRCIPTHANNYDHIVSVEVNGKDRDSYSLNTKGRSAVWKENVLRNFVSLRHPVTFEKTGIQTLKVFVNQTGIVIDQLAITNSTDAAFYEIPLEY